MISLDGKKPSFPRGLMKKEKEIAHPAPPVKHISDSDQAILLFVEKNFSEKIEQERKLPVQISDHIRRHPVARASGSTSRKQT